MVGFTWKTIASAALVVGAAYFSHAQYHYNVVVRRRLGSAQQAIYGTNDAHVITALSPNDGMELEEAVASLVQKVNCSGGKVVYVGRVLRPAATSTIIPLEDSDRFRVVLVTQWPDLPAEGKGFKAFRAEELNRQWYYWNRTWSTPFRRNAAINLLIPAVLYGLRLKTAITQQVHDVATEGTRAEFEKIARPGGEVKFDKVLGIASSLEREKPWAPVMVWNWIKKHENKEARARDSQYGVKMMEMLSQNGGGLMEYGWALPTGRGSLKDESWRHFENVAAVHYPDIGFFIKMLRSRWMQDNVQGKELGDTLALITIPWGWW